MLDYLQIYPDTKALVQRYQPADRCALYEAMMEYAFTSQEPQWEDTDIKWFIWESLKQSVERMEQAKERARKAGNASAEQRRATQANTSQQTSTQVNTSQQASTQGNQESKKEIEIDTEIKKEREITRARETQHRFDTFWAAYPRHTSKETARKAFAKINPDDALLHAMLSAIAKQRDTPQWSDQQYIPHAATWLNQRRWEDEIVQGVQRTQRTVTAQQYTQRSYQGEEEVNMLKEWLQEEGVIAQ